MRPTIKAALVVVAVSLNASCASKWDLRATPSPVSLQWPYAPGVPKLTFVESWTGFSHRKGGKAALETFVYGGDRGSHDAFVLPVAVATGADGRIAVADLGRRCVHLFVPVERRYACLTGEPGERLASPVAVAFDDQSRLYVSDSAGRVLSFGADGKQRLAITKAGDNALRRPTGLAFSPQRQLLYAVDTLANRVDAFGIDGTFRFSFAGQGDGPDRFNFPTHIYRTAAGELVVTNALAFRIELFDEDGAPKGSFGRHGDGSGELAMPKGVAVDADGVIYVVDGLFDNVQLFDRTGQFLLTLGQRGTGFGEFWLPSGAFIDDNQRLYVCDTYNRRIQVFRIAERYADITR
jgi:DNA-binding beta-propeller fold protein YncE